VDKSAAMALNRLLWQL